MKIKINNLKKEIVERIGEQDCSAGFTQLKTAVEFINTHGEVTETYLLNIILDDNEEHVIPDDLSFKKNMHLELESAGYRLLSLSGTVTVNPDVEVKFSNIQVAHLDVKQSRIQDYEFVPLIHVRKMVHGDPNISPIPTPSPTPTPNIIIPTPIRPSAVTTPSTPDRGTTPFFTPSITPPITPPLDDFTSELHSVYVRPEGDDMNDGLTLDTAKRTIQAAINAVANKGSVLVGSGSYDENIIINKSLTLLGENVLINGGKKGSCITCTHGTINITGFTLINGKTEKGGGIYNESNLTLMNCKIALNTAESGAGIYNDGKLTLMDSSMLYNDATDNGGGIYTTSLVKVCRSQILGNTAAHYGGGLCGLDGKIIVNNSQINANRSKQGGGIYAKFGLKLVDTEIGSNTAEVNGGGIYNASDMEIIAGILRNNGTGKEGSGGAIYNLGTFKVDKNTVFMLNVCGLNGGAIYHKANSTMIIHNALFTSNEGFNGGAIYNDGSIVITEAVYVGNIARNFAGAIFNSKTGNIMLNQNAQYPIPFNNNFAYNKGGAIYTQNTIDVKRMEKAKNYPEFMVKG